MMKKVTKAELQRVEQVLGTPGYVNFRVRRDPKSSDHLEVCELEPWHVRDKRVCHTLRRSEARAFVEACLVEGESTCNRREVEKLLDGEWE